MFITAIIVKACMSLGPTCKPRAIGARAIMSCARSDMKNPNNEAFWLSHGYKERPADWKAISLQLRRSGQLTAEANAAAAKTQKTERFLGKVMNSVVLSARSVLGGKTQVLKAGSRMKHTDIATSDLDVYLKMPDGIPMTRLQKQKLAEELRRNVGKRVHEVRALAKSIKLFGADGMTVDIIPSKATFRDPTKLPTPAPKDRFHCNPKAQVAVRILKLHNMKHNMNWKGRLIENAVLEVQRATKGQSAADLYDRALEKMLS